MFCLIDSKRLFLVVGKLSRYLIISRKLENHISNAISNRSCFKLFLRLIYWTNRISRTSFTISKNCIRDRLQSIQYTRLCNFTFLRDITLIIFHNFFVVWNKARYTLWWIIAFLFLRQEETQSLKSVKELSKTLYQSKRKKYLRLSLKLGTKRYSILMVFLMWLYNYDWI